MIPGLKGWGTEGVGGWREHQVRGNSGLNKREQGKADGLWAAPTFQVDSGAWAGNTPSLRLSFPVCELGVAPLLATSCGD